MKQEFATQQTIEDDLRNVMNKYSNSSWQKYICITNVAKEIYEVRE